MQIGKVIRTYRKKKNMTQEEMAHRLGVSAPAVNKWENGNSMPDIMLLSPISRLLDITLDMLLDFREELTDEEVSEYVVELNRRLKNDAYELAFQWAKVKMEQYPNCDRLGLYMAQVLDAWRCARDVPDMEKYDDYISNCLGRVLKSNEEDLRSAAADSLFGFHLRNERYEKAEEYLAYLSKQNPERKRKQALIYSKTDRTGDAYKLYEELLFSGYQRISLVIHSIYMLAMANNDRAKARILVEKQEQLAALFEMGEYNKASFRLDLAVVEKDRDMTLDTLEKILANVAEIGAFSKSPLYGHMVFKEISEEFLADMRTDLRASFRDDEAFGFLKGDRRWEELMNKDDLDVRNSR